MNRLTERLIDLAALSMLLYFAYVMRQEAPELAGGIAVAACAFWLTKNASAPHESLEQATAAAAAEVLKVAAAAAVQAQRKALQPQEVEVINTEAAPVPIIHAK